MNRILSILALIGILLQSFGKAYVVLCFEVKQEYIAKNLCVKKAEPDNCCKGHCYLAEQLEEEEEKEKSSSPVKTENKQEVQFFVQNIKFSFYTDLLGMQTTPCTSDFPQGSLHSIFRPPKV